MRSCLTVLSLIIGVAAVIAMVGIGNGARTRVQESIASLDLGRISLSARQKIGNTGWRLGFSNGAGLTVADYVAIRSAIPNLAAATPRLEPTQWTGQVSAGGRGSAARIIGMDVEGFRLESRRLVRGALFGPEEVRQAASVCVITESAAAALFGNAEGVGQLIRVREVPFRVIGVVSDRVSATEATELLRGTAQVIMPFTSLVQRIDRSAAGSMQIWMRAGSPEQIPILKRELSNLMERRRGSRKAEFALYTTADTAAAYTTSSNTLALLLALISGISLLVGGVGIMNVMLMSVKERTREIGIRLAVGARERDIWQQVLLEALMLSSLGGLIGVVVGLASAGIVSSWNGWPVSIGLPTIAGAFLLSVAVGAFFGYYPARRAAALNPIEALRMS